MPTLGSDLRNKLEKVVVEARDVAEAGARAALEALAVHHHEPYPHMKPAQRTLRNHLRARARQLGDQQDKAGRLAITHLVGECAYEHWHRMLFARFLAENHLLIEPQEKIAISLAEAEELAKEEGVDVWVFASRCAQDMLPQIFRPDDPLLQVSFATEHQLRLEGLLASLPSAVFTASDALGWVYQFWQSKKKDEVNRSEVKIGADEISAVTQLFTEPYMVEFLLHNTLGAWWAGKVAAASSRWSLLTTEVEGRQACALPGLTWDYLRFIEPEPVGFYRKDEPVEKTAANLPHWRQEAVTYFVTFRTADSLPQERLQQWLDEKEQWLAAHPEPRDDKTMQEYFKRFPERIEHWLDQGHGACQLKKTAIRKIVEEALRHFEGERYTLDEFAIAGNHVHVLVTPKEGHEFSAILHSWKSFTANAINRAIGQSGAFWQKESFDHIVRNPAQLERVRAYIRDHEAKRQDAASTLRPAAGMFDGWPKAAKGIKVLDPCCGSGHFLVAALHHLVPIRMSEEGLSARDAVDAVVRDNLHGLEIDERCCQIAAFALAFAAWTYPDAGGYRPLPDLHIACTGIGPQSTEEQWVKLAEQSGIPMPTVGREAIKEGLRNLHRLFVQAPILGSLINPTELPSDLIAADYETIQPYLTAIREVEKTDDETRERAIAAAGMVKAADLLAGEYTLVVTNVPYLGRGKQDGLLKAFLERNFNDGKADLATAFVLRCLECCAEGGTAGLVTPQIWLFLEGYRTLREKLLDARTWRSVVRLGSGAFGTIGGAVVNTALFVLERSRPSNASKIAAVDVSAVEGASAKGSAIPEVGVALVSQRDQRLNPDSRVTLTDHVASSLLGEFVRSTEGLSTGDRDRFIRQFWEFDPIMADWEFFQSAPSGNGQMDGFSEVVYWQDGRGVLSSFSGARVQGHAAWGRPGVLVGRMSAIRAGFYAGHLYDKSCVVLTPKRNTHLPPVSAFCMSLGFEVEIRRLDKKLGVATSVPLKVPFGLEEWEATAAGGYPDGLPEPESDDPTQWLFHGHPYEADEDAMLQVAVARLLGYRWPAELDDKMRLSKRARGLVKECDELLKFADDDGIVCIPSVRGEEPAAERLLKLLEACGGSGILPLSSKSAAGSRSHLDLDDWLRNEFFAEHCKLFHDRPFVWHIWDGRKRDGFHALVNYHKLCGSGILPLSSESAAGSRSHPGRKVLESLTYSYLGDWITRQKDEVKRGEGGAEDRLAAALELRKRLEAILAGEPPFDLFVRWKPLHEQPIGWEPDINDGVRLNIRPFLASDLPNGRKGAGILRYRPNIKWTKDRGKEPERSKADYPWFWGWDEKTEDFQGGKTFDGNRWNDCHYTNKTRQQAREAAEEKS